MQMADEDTIKVGRVDPGALERRKQRRPSLHQDVRAVGFDNVAGLEATSACEGIACAQYGYLKLAHRRQIIRSDGGPLWYYRAKREPS